MQKRDEFDQLLKRMAAEYVEQYGKDLMAEQEALEIEKSISPTLDSKTKNKILYFKQKKATKILGLVAACALIAVVLPAMINQIDNKPLEISAASIQETIKIEERAEQFSSPVAELEESPEMEGAELPEMAASDVAPIEINLPEGFFIISDKQDSEQTIFSIESPNKNKITLKTRYSSALPALYDYKKFTMNKTEVYAKASKDENKENAIFFVKNDVLYEITSNENIETLKQLAESIIK